jgi:hypothetical protein
MNVSFTLGPWRITLTAGRRHTIEVPRISADQVAYCGYVGDHPRTARERRDARANADLNRQLRQRRPLK